MKKEVNNVIINLQSDNLENCQLEIGKAGFCVKKEEISIAVVDDNPAVNKKTKAALAGVFKLEVFDNIKFQVDTYESGKHLLEVDKEYDLIVMDYKMPQMNGIEVATKLSKRGIKTRILFLSGYEEIIKPLQQAVSIRLAAGFIFKSDPVQEFQQEVKRIVKEILDVHCIKIKHYEEVLDIDNNKFTKVFYETVIDTKKIVTIEINQKIAYVYTEEDEFLTNISLKDWLPELPSGDFSYANKSCLVNLRYVCSYSSKKINLMTKDTLELGRYSKEKFEKSYERYVMREAMK